MARKSGANALNDAGMVTVRCSRAMSAKSPAIRCPGQRAPYELGMNGMPIVNVNNCSTSSRGLFLAVWAIRDGVVNCIIALGFETMQLGSLSGGNQDRESPMAEINEFAMPVTPWMFGAAGHKHMRQIRHQCGALRQDWLQKPETLGEQPVCVVPGVLHARRYPSGAGDLRSAH